MRRCVRIRQIESARFLESIGPACDAVTGRRQPQAKRPHIAILALPFCHHWLRSSKPDQRYPVQFQRLGDHLRKLQLDLGLFQKEAVARLGADSKTVNNWETGKSEPRLCFVPPVIAFLGCGPRPEEATFGRLLF